MRVMQNAESGTSLLHRGLHLAALGTLAIAYPLLSVIQSRPQFLAARGLTPAEIRIMVLLLCAAIPAVLVLVETVVVICSRKAGTAVHSILMATLFTLLLLPIFAKIGTRSWIVFPTGLAMGVLFALLYSKSADLRMYVSFLAIAILVVPYNFLASSQVARAMKTQIPHYPVYTGPAPKHTVVVLILDELALVLLLDGKNEIDEGRFPAFAKLSRTATWYRNATTNADETLLSVPSILTGQYADNSKLPRLADYPENLLSYFSASFRMNVFESFTFLGPDSSRALREESERNRVGLLMEDLTAVYLRVIAPDDLRWQLPPVEQTWGGFWRDQRPVNSIVQFEDPRSNRHLAAQQMIQSLKGAPAPSFNYLHLMLPHVPLEHLPSGRRYDGRSFGPNGADGQLQGDLWETQPQPVLRAFQRDLLQTMFADRVLAEILQKLQDQNMYEDAMIVVTSDHGSSFIPGQWRRTVNRVTMGDIMPVPLFIKYPHQVDGRTDDGNVELVDVAPTIADAVGSALPWKTDGVSLLKTPAPARTTKSVLCYTAGKWLKVKEEDVRLALHRQLVRKLQLFGEGTEFPIYTMNDPSGWIGKSVEAIPVSGDSPYQAQLKHGETLENVDLSKDPLPCLVRGRILGYDGEVGKLRIAIAVNGKIEALTRDEKVENWPRTEKINVFVSMLPESALRKGKNLISVFVMTEDTGTVQFRRIPLIAAGK